MKKLLLLGVLALAIFNTTTTFACASCYSSARKSFMEADLTLLSNGVWHYSILHETASNQYPDEKIITLTWKPVEISTDAQAALTNYAESKSTKWMKFTETSLIGSALTNTLENHTIHIEKGFINTWYFNRYKKEFQKEFFYSNHMVTVKDVINEPFWANWGWPILVNLILLLWAFVLFPSFPVSSFLLLIAFKKSTANKWKWKYEIPRLLLWIGTLVFIGTYFHLMIFYSLAIALSIGFATYYHKEIGNALRPKNVAM